MDRHWMHKVITSVLLLQTAGMAHAEYISPYQSGEVLAAMRAAAAAPYEGTAKIASITRQKDGEIYVLDLSKALPLTQIKVKPSVGKIRIIAANLINEKKERIALKALTNVTIAATDEALGSEILSTEIGIATIEIRAEAMGGEAALDVKALSTKEAPQLALREELSCKQKLDTILKEKLDIVQRWAGRIDASAPGSIQEKYAIKEFNKYVSDFNATLKTDKASYASTDYTLTLLNFFAERYNASRDSSAAESAYKSMATESFNVLLESAQSELPCRTISSEGLTNIALDFQKRSEAAKPESRAGKLYETMIIQIAKIIPPQYRKELATKNFDFRQADNEGNKYYKLFLASKPESFLKGTHLDMSLSAYAIAEQALVKEVQQMDNEKRYQLIVEYQAKYNDPTHFHQETMMKYLLIISEQGTLFRIML
jgi:hypothetical protein